MMLEKYVIRIADQHADPELYTASRRAVRGKRSCASIFASELLHQVNDVRRDASIVRRPITRLFLDAVLVGTHAIERSIVEDDERATARFTAIDNIPRAERRDSRAPYIPS